MNKGTNLEEYRAMYGGDRPNSAWGEQLAASIHTHPSDNPFSDRDLQTYIGESTMRTGANQSDMTGNFSIVVAAKTTYGVEIVDAKKAIEIYNADPLAITKVYNEAFRNAKGSSRARIMAGVKAVMKMFQGSIKFYVDDSNNGTSVKEVK